MPTLARLVVALSCLVALEACGGGTPDQIATDDAGDQSGQDPLKFGLTDGGFLEGDAFVDSLTVAGDVVAFDDGAPVTGAVTLDVLNMTPAPTVTVTGAQFSMTNVQPFSVFGIASHVAPGFRTTYGSPVRIDSMPLTGVHVLAVKESQLTAFATAFAIAPQAGKGIAIVRFVDKNGAPLSGLDVGAIQIAGAAPPQKPRVLAADKQAMPSSTSTTGSGAVVLYDVAPGPLTLTATAASGYTFAAPIPTVAADAVTLLTVTVTTGAVVLPKGVSFSKEVMPLFINRGCANCHSGGGIGKTLGGLMLDGGKMNVYRQVTQDVSPNFNTKRVDLLAPEKSLILTMPSYESPADPHPTVIFASTTDADYLKLVVWIKEGALNN